MPSRCLDTVNTKNMADLSTVQRFNC